MNGKTAIAIVILAAGSSSRMGRIKQLLPWNNSCLLGNSISKCVKSKANAVYVVLGANYNEIVKEIEKEAISLIKNDSWKKGMGSSIKAALNYFEESNLNYKSVLFTLADQPFITSEYYNLMMDSFSNSDKGIIATKQGEKSGVPAIFDSSYFPELMKLDSDYGAKNLIKAQLNDVKQIASNIDFTDIDTFEVYQNLVIY